MDGGGVRRLRRRTAGCARGLGRRRRLRDVAAGRAARALRAQRGHGRAVARDRHAGRRRGHLLPGGGQAGRGAVTLRRRGFLASLLGSGLVWGLGTGASAAPSDPEGLIQRTIDEVFAILKDPSLAGRERRGQRLAALRVGADRTFDWAEMARASLGAPWRTLDADRRRRFVDVFKDVLAARYMDDINRFQGTETGSVDGSSRDGDDTIVRTTLVTGSRERVPMDYRLRASGDRSSIVDISIEGVSLVNHYRKTFAAALVNVTVEQLTDRLAKQLPPASRR